MNLHNIIRNEHGQDCVKLLRDYENSAKKVARFKNHLRFNLHCKHHGITPTSLTLRTCVRGSEANNIILRAQKQLLNTRIGQTVRKLQYLEKKKDQQETGLSQRLPSKQLEEVTNFVKDAQLKEHEVTKTRQQGKYAKLVEKQKSKEEATNKGNKQKTLANEIMERWVKNCSQRILSDPELSVLKKGLNFAVVPKQLPVVDLVTVTETACRSLPANDASELRAKVATVISKNRNIKESNISNDEWRAIESLKKDENVMVLPADKGRVTVVLDKEEYTKKCMDLLSDQRTYKKLKSDPTAKYKRDLVELLKEIKEKFNLPQSLYKQLYPTNDQPPRFYGLPKVHKVGYPLRPIVSSIGTITYGCAQYLAKILSPLVGKTPYHVKNSVDFVEVICGQTLQDDEEMRSFDVSALFTSVPVDKALDIIKARLQQDQTLKERTALSPEDIIRLLSLCLNCTYFTFQKNFYLQTHGAAMGSPVSPIVCNLYMENFEQRALTQAEHPPRLWKRYVDDTFTILKINNATQFSNYLNTIDEDIKWTSEEQATGESTNGKERQLAFLDTLVVAKEDGTIITRVFRKETHTNQYLNFNSNHPIEHKRGVVRTLLHRAEKVVSGVEDRREEEKLIKDALAVNGYPKWILKETNKDPKQKNTLHENTSHLPSKKKYPVILPYVKGVSEQLRRIFKQYKITTYFKPINTLRHLLVHPKDILDKERIVGPVYHISCEDCSCSYVGETERSLKARFQEHRRPSSVTSEVSKHINLECPGHSVKMDKTKVLAVEQDWFKRGIKEAIYIRTLKPSLNRDGGRHNLHQVWTNLLLQDICRGGGPHQQ